MLGIPQDEPLLGAVYAFCARRCGPGGVVARAALDTVEMPREALPNLVLFDVFDGGTRFRWRLSGTEIVNQFGRDATGRFGDEVLTGQYLAFITSLVEQVSQRRVPVYSRSVFHWEGGRRMATSRLYIPLADGDDVVTQVLAAHDFGSRRGYPRDPATLWRDTSEIEELVRLELPFDTRA